MQPLPSSFRQSVFFFALLALAASCKLHPHILGAAPGKVASWLPGPELEPCRQLIEANRVDVPTLLEMTDDEVLSAFALTSDKTMGAVSSVPAPRRKEARNADATLTAEGRDVRCVDAVQRVVRRLRSNCQCDQPIADFWSALRQDNWRTWVHGSLVLFTPRIAWLYAYFYDAALFAAMLQGAVIPSAYVAWAMIIVCPDVFFAINALPFVTSNYVLVAFAVQHFLVQCFEEVMIVLLLIGSYRTGTSIFEPGTTLFGKLTTILPWWLFLPVVAVVTGWLQVPFMLQQIAVVAFVVQGMYVTKTLVSQNFGGSAEPS